MPKKPRRRRRGDRSGAVEIDWARLIEVARRVALVPPDVGLTSRRPPAVEARLLVAMVATQRFGQPYSAVASALGMTVGGVSNLLARKAGADGISERFARTVAAFGV